MTKSSHIFACACKIIEKRRLNAGNFLLFKPMEFELHTQFSIQYSLSNGSRIKRASVFRLFATNLTVSSFPA